MGSSLRSLTRGSQGQRSLLPVILDLLKFSPAGVKADGMLAANGRITAKSPVSWRSRIRSFSSIPTLICVLCNVYLFLALGERSSADDAPCWGSSEQQSPRASFHRRGQHRRLLRFPGPSSQQNHGGTVPLSQHLAEGCLYLLQVLTESDIPKRDGRGC